MQILDADLLRAFVAFADTLSFTHAAKRVHLSQPALFERVRRASDLLDARLYERTGKTLRLTDAGQRVAAFARESLARAEGFVRELRGEAPRDVVTVAAGEGTWLYLLPEIARRFASRLEPLALGSAAAIDAVRSGRADLAVTVADVPAPDLVAVEVARAPMCVAVHARHPLARTDPVRLDALARERLVVPPTGRLYRDLVARLIAMRGAELVAPIEADGWPLMLAYARAGLGVAVVNGICVPPPGVALRPVPELGVVAYKLLRRRDRALSGAASELAAAITSARGAASAARSRGRAPTPRRRG